LTENVEKEKTKKDEGSVETLNDEYFSYPYQFCIQDAEKRDSKEIEKTKTEVEQKFLELLKGINEETLQLSEIAIEEKKLAHELCDLLKQILSNLNMTIIIPSKAIPPLKEEKEIILNAQGNLILVSEEGNVDCKLLEDYSPDIILMAAWGAVPQLKESITSYRKKIGLRVNFFNKINRELKNVQGVFLTSKEKTEEEDLEEVFQEDAVKKLLQQEKTEKSLQEEAPQEGEIKELPRKDEIKKILQEEEKISQKEEVKKPIQEDAVKKLLQEDEVKKLFREDGVKKFLEYYKVKVKGQSK
jgi:hypothetical protein